MVALALNSSAYVAEIFRGGILAVDFGQTEAARSLGLTAWDSMKLVVLPQAIKNVLPALANEIITMVKDFYGTMGFDRIREDENGSVWSLPVTGAYKNRNRHIEVEGVQ